jgi:acyl carrier protein
MNATAARTVLVDLLRRVAPEVDLDAIDPEVDLQDAADLDSMDFLNLVTALHETTGIDVPERDYPALATVSGFVGYVVARSP